MFEKLEQCNSLLGYLIGFYMEKENASNNRSLIIRGTRDQFPDLVRLSEKEVLEMHTKTIDKWTPKSEMYPLIYGPMALGVVSFTSLMVTGEVFRKAVLLPKVGVFAVGLPVSLLSAVATSMFQTDVIMSDVLLLKTPCLPCVQGKCALIQGFAGSIYPTCLLIGGSLLTAYKLDTTYVPPIRDEKKKFFQMCQQMTRTRASLLSSLFLINLAAAFAISYLEQEAALKLYVNSE